MDNKEFFEIYNSAFEKLKKCKNEQSAMKILQKSRIKNENDYIFGKLAENILYKLSLSDNDHFWEIVPKIIFEWGYPYENLIKYLLINDSAITVLNLVPDYTAPTTRNKLYDILSEAFNAHDESIYPLEIRKTKGYYKHHSLIDEFYYITTNIYFKKYKFSRVTLYFQTFKEFADYLNNDLSDCDLKYADLDGVDLSQYKINEKTKLDVKYITDPLVYKTKKYFNGNYYIIQTDTIDKFGNVVNNNIQRFSDFDEFVRASEYDLTNCDLSELNDLDNSSLLLKCNIEKSYIRSSVLLKVGFPEDRLEKYVYHSENIESFPLILENEKETKYLVPISENNCSYKIDRILYISDIHFLHKIINNDKFKSKSDIDIYLKNRAQELLKNTFSNPVIIAGDISSDIKIYKTFIKYLSEIRKKIIIIPGNHDLWSMKKETWRDELKELKKYVEDCGLIFLQNSVAYMDNWYEWKIISEKELNELSVEEIRCRTKRARCIIFGGLGFTGYNPLLNASVGLYRNLETQEFILDYEEDLIETKRFEALYEKIEECFENREIIIATHTHLTDWLSSGEYHNHWIYISGHDHKNYLYDDGIKRIYANNQIGYNLMRFKLKPLSMDFNYDVFADYKDGIYRIDYWQYMDFNHGKNIIVNFHSYDTDIVMLKRNKYYCFISEAKSGNLCLLNGGKKEKLKYKDIRYYYNNMDKEIEMLLSPVTLYYEREKKISEYVKMLGGCGTIHGCIIDIDFYNHIYLNPYDNTMTCYWAYDMINKKVYNNLPSLLKHECPSLYDRYCEFSDNENAIKLMDNDLIVSDETTPYLSTDIYSPSRQMKALQYLVLDNVLRKWYDINKESRREIINNIPLIE